MRGHEALLAMRRRGKRPAHVTLHAHDGGAYPWASVPELLPYPEIQVEPADVPELLDLRCLVGLPVIVDGGENVERMKRIVLAAEAAGAAVVYGVAGRIVSETRIHRLGSACTTGEDQTWRTS